MTDGRNKGVTLIESCGRGPGRARGPRLGHLSCFGRLSVPFASACKLLLFLFL